MKGKIAKINPKTWGSEGKTLYEFFIDGSTMKYVCFQNMADKKEGDEIEFDPQGPPDTYGSTKVRLAGQGAKPGFSGRVGKSPEEIKLQARSFAASYSKDIICACIEKGILPDSKGIDAAILHYDNLFKGILE